MPATLHGITISSPFRHPVLIRTALHVLSPGGPRARLSVLIFHRVLPAPDPLNPGDPDAPRFDAILGWLRDWFNVLPLAEAVERLRACDLPPRALAITFDDGYADNHDIALPILRRHGLSATFFIATGFLDGGRMWNDGIIEALRRCRLPELDLRGLVVKGLDRFALSDTESRRHAIAGLLPALKYQGLEQRTALVQTIAERAEVVLPNDLMMSTAQLRALYGAGMGIGAHTVRHPILARLSAADARREIEDGRATLERLTGKPVQLFAYPNGKPGQDYLPRCVDLVRELGFSAAVTTSPGAAGHNASAFELPRFTPWDRTRIRFGARLVSNARSRFA